MLFALSFINGCEELEGNFSELTIKEVAEIIDMKVGDAEAESLSSCTTIAIGAKPCGGPWGYLVYSDEQSDTQNLERLVKRYTELDSIRNIEEERGSTCDMAREPKIELRDGRCYGTEGHAWNPGDILRFNNITK